ncbi:MAG: protein-tyrosine-phosphatase [Acidobacteriota bacterium]|nr:protein-tyrosine-phosphatase [Acidobacteriota bacterium]
MLTLIIAVLPALLNGPDAMFFPELQTYVDEIVAEYQKIPETRKKELGQIAAYVQRQVDKGEKAQLNFICTHNSRRSHMSQIWAQTAAAYYGVPGVQAYSGGTEATAFNPRAVAALKRAGFDIDQTTNVVNPIYHVRFQKTASAMTAFSKVYSDAPNPKQSYCAVMTCSDADKACPAVLGASARIAVPYEDPKVVDNTSGETAKYDERTRQIGREMFFAFSLVKKK